MSSTDALDQAAAAFDREMGGPGGKASTAKSQGEDAGPTESLFGNIDQVEVDDESPARGGGDDDEDAALYGKDTKARARNPRDKDGSDRDGDDADGPRKPGEDESDDEDDDTGEEGAEDGEEGAEDEETDALLEREVEVTVDGDPVKVPLKEALEGYVRTETFHRRMNQLDEAKKIVRRAATDAVQNYEFSMNLAKQMEEYMKTVIPAEPDWDKEFAADPAKARELQRYYEKANAFKAQMKTQMDEANKKMAESNHTQLQTFAEEEGQKFEAANRKQWTDPKKKVKDLASMRKTGLSMGFTEEELTQVYDSRMLQILLKASKYDRMMAAKPKPVIKNAGKPITPGAGSARQRTARKGVDQAMKRLSRTGSIEDAAPVFDRILANS